MREIKFREAIYKDGGFCRFHYWGYDDGGQSDAFLNSKRYGTNLDSFSEDRKLYIKANEQYTGLKDKDGNEIYEGDLIGENKRLVVFTGGQFAVDCGVYKISLHNFISNDPNRIVVGNVHENKEHGKH